MSPARFSNYGSGRGSRARPVDRPEIQTGRASPKFKQNGPFRAWEINTDKNFATKNGGSLIN
jgi:hypothetical protein